MAKETKRTQLGIVIDARMKERGITAEQLADAVGVDVATVNRWRNGKTKMPDPGQIAKICLELHIWPNVLMRAAYPEEMARLASELGDAPIDTGTTLASVPEFAGLLDELTALEPETLRALMLLARKARGG